MSRERDGAGGGVADREWPPAVAMVLDDATRRRMASVAERLPEHLERLRAGNPESLDAAAADLRAEMERLGEHACELVACQPPRSLLGYLWSTHFVGILGDVREKGDEYRPDKIKGEELQFVLEYVHAAWSSIPELADEKTPLDQAKVAALFETLDELRLNALLFGQVYALASMGSTGDGHRGGLIVLALGAWSNLRGRRHQTLEGEFLGFLLRPHDEALRRSYGMGADAVAASVQGIADSTREGLAEAAESLFGAAERWRAEDGASGEVAAETVATGMAAYDDLLRGGVCSLSRHTDMTPPLLEDLSYVPGENKEFLAPGEFRATPFRALPGLVKPGINLGGEYFVTDGQFVRDIAYRTIQRGLLGRDPAYREDWNDRQKSLMENAFTTIFAGQLRGAKRYAAAFYREAGTGNWAETDLLVVYEDVLLIVEAKAGVLPMHSPAADFDAHMKRVEGLVVSAYRQCFRVMEALAAGEALPIYELHNGKHEQVAELDLQDFRLVLPIGLTVEAISPFSTCLNSLEAIKALPEGHAFMSMSLDDLLVLNRFLRTSGELLHYLEVRQRAVGVPDVIVIDEMEYLGAYIEENRFDDVLERQRAAGRGVVWNAYADVVDRYFEGENAGTGPVPKREFPAALSDVLGFLNRRRPRGWLAMDAAIRNLDGDERENLSHGIDALKKTLNQKPYRRMLMFDGMPLLVWVCRSGQGPPARLMDREARLACLIAEAQHVRVLRLVYKRRRKLTGVACASVGAPDSSRPDYGELVREASARKADAVERFRGSGS
ncbi:MAG: hypothetical protein OXH52_11350 [Gammaproteobacteria bacterium]|nr:hypothetical protein [Gammaproteobacteria bacterium]